ncbi:hypothetical protein Poli38472_001586 [Pythium oligandrum]|uniref:Kinesin light chain n=1 Tax=Pythium oligandrum TaxID=41045 RepID=A0A8K1CTQ6_PYTOL|nr:hypothetical protein Poli38472_001586 [Pythium oligandrum]|eukprot:TMW69430.1 hypothetical protein Poli38472_001586 [Pythium oligandrum]
MRLTVLLVLVATLLLHAHAEEAEAPKKSAATQAHDDNPVIQTVRGLRNTAMRSNDQKNYPHAIDDLREALTLMHDRVFGATRATITDSTEQSLDAALYAQLLNDYGSVLTRAKDYDEAIDVLEDAVEMIKRVFGKSHPSYGLALRSLAEAHFAKENYETAIEKYKLLRKQAKLGLGTTHEGYVEVHLRMSQAYQKMGDMKKAVKVLKKVLKDQGDDVNGATQGIGEVYMDLASLQTKNRELDDAERAGEAARAIMKLRDGENSVTHAFSLNTLAGVKMAQNKVAEAYELLKQAHWIAIKVFGRKHKMVEASQKTLDQVKQRLEDEKKRDFDEL